MTETKQQVVEDFVTQIAKDSPAMTDADVEIVKQAMLARYAMARDETAEQVKCPLCHSDGHTRMDNRSKWGSQTFFDVETGVGWTINLSRRTLIMSDMITELPIKACPYCGRKLDQ